jgi:hypothetical protein
MLSLQRRKHSGEAMKEYFVDLDVTLPDGTSANIKGLIKEMSPARPRSKTALFDPCSVELPFKTERFERLWARWATHRAEIRKPLTSTSVRQQLKRLEEWGEKKATMAIETAIAAGWTGLFEPTTDAASPNTFF